MTPTELNQYIHVQAVDLGFDRCAVLTCKPLDRDFARFEQWLGLGNGADMEYLHRNMEMRHNPELLIEGTKSLIVTLISYNPGEMHPGAIDNVSATEAWHQKVIVARYAQFKDYHHTLKQMQGELLERIRQVYPTADGRCFVDSAPVMERALAAAGGLGWIGRNSMLIDPKLGSYTFIGVVMLNTKVDSDEVVAQKDRCGNCTRCVDSCPTGAILNDRSVDARRCIAYQTIENRGEIPHDIQKKLSGRIFGCDICQEVCPWNKKAAVCGHKIFAIEQKIAHLDVVAVTKMSGGEFKRTFFGTPLLRAGLKKLKSTIFYVVDNQ